MDTNKEVMEMKNQRKRKKRNKANVSNEKFKICWWTMRFIHKSTQLAFDKYFHERRKRLLLCWCVFAIMFFTPFTLQLGLKHPSTIYAMVHIWYMILTAVIAFVTLFYLLVVKTSKKMLHTLKSLNFIMLSLGMPVMTFQMIDDETISPPMILWTHIVWYGIFLGFVIMLHINYLLFWAGNILFYTSMILATELMYRLESVERLPISQLSWSAGLSILMTAKIVHSALLTNCLLFQNLRMVEVNKEKEISQRVQDLKRQYVAQTLHDIGTPLTTLTLGQEMFEQWELPEELDDIVKTNNCALEMMVLTRKKALDYMKFEDTGLLIPNLAPTNLRYILHEKCRRIMTGFNSGSDVGLRFVIEENVNPNVITDGDWIWEMLCNYLSNAMKFTKHGCVEARVSLSDQNRFIMFEVSDTGPGICDDQKKLLFQPFSQLQQDCGGTGLGLYSVSCKAFSLHGTVGVRDNTKAESGAVFYFTIPNRTCASDSDMNHIDICNSPIPTDRMEHACSTISENKALSDSMTGSEAAGTSNCRLSTFDMESIETLSSKKSKKTSIFCEPLAAPLEVAPQSDPPLVLPQESEKVGLPVKSPRAANDKYREELNSSLETLQRYGSEGHKILSPGCVSAELFIDGGSSSPMHSFDSPATSSRSITSVGLNKKTPVMKFKSERDQHFFPEESSSRGEGTLMPKNTESEDKNEGSVKSRKHLKYTSSKSQSVSTSFASEKKLLLIEDEMSIAKFFIRMLSKVGFQVSHAENGLLGLERMKLNFYYVVLCDITMPGIDGYETVKRFREWEESELNSERRKEKQIIIALSANQIPEDQQKAIDCGFNSFLSKPVKLKDLLTEIEKQKNLSDCIDNESGTVRMEETA
mmetsp:Transcript_18530/g.24474  ORF Transcript_18530/g.24474 Transcript_18530/m.24474 type:complete len:868 (-) Transcript_18530:144-2747(-)